MKLRPNIVYFVFDPFLLFLEMLITARVFKWWQEWESQYVFGYDNDTVIFRVKIDTERLTDTSMATTVTSAWYRALRNWMAHNPSPPAPITPTREWPGFKYWKKVTLVYHYLWIDVPCSLPQLTTGISSRLVRNIFIRKQGNVKHSTIQVSFAAAIIL